MASTPDATGLAGARMNDIKSEMRDTLRLAQSRGAKPVRWFMSQAGWKRIAENQVLFPATDSLGPTFMGVPIKIQGDDEFMLVCDA
jgi:hypothetical protein